MAQTAAQQDPTKGAVSVPYLPGAAMVTVHSVEEGVGGVGGA